jgi:hypothetical protein
MPTYAIVGITGQVAFDGVDGVFIMTPTWFAAQDMFAENAKALTALGATRGPLTALPRSTQCCPS